MRIPFRSGAPSDIQESAQMHKQGLPDFKETRLKLVTINDPQELFATLDHIAQRWGEEAPEVKSVYGL